jgi:ACS family tartrate transporter-like MFS transporter
MTNPDPTVGERARRKIALRLIPFLFVLYITAYIDRVNVSFAGLDMTRDLHFSNEVFGFGAGIFFFGYCLLEIPGAMLAESWSAREWIATIMVVWGALATLTGFIQGSLEFNIIRFMLGFAEGGFFPAVIVYLTHWFRPEDRAKTVAMFMAAIPASNAIGAPIAGLLLKLDWLGIPGWRWLLILEGIPALLFGVITWFYLTDRPRHAKWLTEDERNWIQDELAREAATRGPARHATILESLRQPLVLALALSYFLMNTSGYGLTLWLPKFLQKLQNLTHTELSLIAAIPPLCAIPAMLWTGWHSDRTGERKWHAVGAAILCAAGFLLSQAVTGSPAWAVTGFAIAAMGNMAFYPVFWGLPYRLMNPVTAAASFGFINLIANFGGFVGPYLIGWLTDRTGSYFAGVLLLVSTAILSGVVLLFLRDHPPVVETEQPLTVATLPPGIPPNLQPGLEPGLEPENL